MTTSMKNSSSDCMLPSYTLRPAPDLLPWISDFWLSLLLPVVIYWSLSLIFVVSEYVDASFQWPSYHTWEEKQVRNMVTKRYVFWVTIRNQIIQTSIAYVLASLQGPETVGKEQHDITAWACTLRQGFKVLSQALIIVGVDGPALATKLSASNLNFPGLKPSKSLTPAYGQAFSETELRCGRVMYYYVVPAIQFFLAFMITDIWQYFGHRLEHEWKWLYKTVHSVHHQLYVPWAWAAFYMHPAELILLDTVSILLAFPIAQLSTKQGIFFTTVVTFKALSDHAGFDLAWNPVYKMFGANDASFHDIHHQRWGFKYNFGIYSTFWDRLFGTLWTDKQLAESRYQASAEAARVKFLTIQAQDQES